MSIGLALILFVAVPAAICAVGEAAINAWDHWRHPGAYHPDV